MGGWALLPRVSDRKTGRIVRSCFAELFGTFSVVFWGAGAALDAADATKTLHLAFGFGIGRHAVTQPFTTQNLPSPGSPSTILQ